MTLSKYIYGCLSATINTRSETILYTLLLHPHTIKPPSHSPSLSTFFNINQSINQSMVWYGTIGNFFFETEPPITTTVSVKARGPELGPGLGPGLDKDQGLESPSETGTTSASAASWFASNTRSNPVSSPVATITSTTIATDSDDNQDRRTEFISSTNEMSSTSSMINDNERSGGNGKGTVIETTIVDTLSQTQTQSQQQQQQQQQINSQTVDKYVVTTNIGVKTSTGANSDTSTSNNAVATAAISTSLSSAYFYTPSRNQGAATSGNGVTQQQQQQQQQSSRQEERNNDKSDSKEGSGWWPFNKGSEKDQTNDNNKENDTLRIQMSDGNNNKAEGGVVDDKQGIKWPWERLFNDKGSDNGSDNDQGQKNVQSMNNNKDNKNKERSGWWGFNQDSTSDNEKDTKEKNDQEKNPIVAFATSASSAAIGASGFVRGIGKQ